MRRVIVMCSFFWVLGLNICAQEDLSRSTATTTTIVENPDKYKVETNRFWSNWFVSVGGGALMYFGVRHWMLLSENGLRRALVYV